MVGKMADEKKAKPWNRSLRARLVGHFLLLSLLIVTLAGYLAYFGARRALEQSVFERLSAVASNEEDQLRGWVESQRRDVVHLASLPELRAQAAILLGDAAPERREVASARLRRLFRSTISIKPGLREVFVLSGAGGRIALSTNRDLEGEYRVRDSFFIRGLEDTFVQNVYPSPVEFKPTLTISTPLAESDGSSLSPPFGLTRIGVLAAHLNLDELDRVVHDRAGLGASGESYLVDKYNDFVSGTHFGREQFPRGVHTEGIDSAVAGRDGTGRYANYKGVPVLGVYRWIDDLELALLVEIPQREAFAPARGIARLIFGVGLVLALMLAAGSVLLAHQISRPIRRISEAALQVAIGNLEAHAPVSTRDEIGVLARSFNEMTRRLRMLYDDLKQEIAEHRLAQEELEAKNAELERFTYTVSHDLKSPLVTIKGFLGLLQKDAAAGNEERMRRDVERIQSAAETMNRLLDELLELSRVGRQINPPEDVALGELARLAVEILAGEIEAGAVEIEIVPDMPAVSGDRVRLLEVFQNLLANAVKFMGDQESPRIEVGVRETGDEPVIFVRDNGMGIDPKYQEKIFGLFERLDGEVEGTGVGLALVKRTVEVHGGRIWVESPGLDYGSAFCFTLPVSA